LFLLICFFKFFIKLINYLNIIFNFISFYFKTNWGLGIGDWGLGIGVWGFGGMGVGEWAWPDF
jgi:hypothetical protein